MESCRRSDGYNISNFRVWFFFSFFVGLNEFVSVLAMYSDASTARGNDGVSSRRPSVRRLDFYWPSIRKKSSSYSRAGLFQDQSWSMTRF